MTDVTLTQTRINLVTITVYSELVTADPDIHKIAFSPEYSNAEIKAAIDSRMLLMYSNCDKLSFTYSVEFVDYRE